MEVVVSAGQMIWCNNSEIKWLMLMNMVVVALTKLIISQYYMYLDEWLCGVWLVDSDLLGPLPLNGQSSLPHLHWMLGLLQLSKLVNAQLKKYTTTAS